MKTQSLISQIRAAQRLSMAFEAGQAPTKADFEILGMPSRLKSQFTR